MMLPLARLSAFSRMNDLRADVARQCIRKAIQALLLFLKHGDTRVKSASRRPSQALGVVFLVCCFRNSAALFSPVVCGLGDAAKSSDSGVGTI
jgi:hypothetical protein